MHQELWGYKVEERIYLGIRERKKVEYHWVSTEMYFCQARKNTAVTLQRGQNTFFLIFCQIFTVSETSQSICTAQVRV